MCRYHSADIRLGKAKILAFTGYCPYLRVAGNLKDTKCECAKFKFPDKETRREVLYGRCGHPTEWQTCFIKQAMDNYYYERKYSGDKNESHSGAVKA